MADVNMIPALIGLTAASLSAGVVAVPVLRRTTFGSVKQDWLAGELELDRVEADGMTVRTKAGTVFRVIEILGQSYETKPIELQELLHQGRSEALHQIASKGGNLRFFGVKRLIDVSRPTTWPSVTLQEIGDAEVRHNQNSYSIRWFVVLSGKDQSKLNQCHDLLLSFFSDYKPKTLRLAEQEQACPLSGFLNYLLCGEYRDDLPVVSQNISANLPASDIGFDADGTMTVQVPERYIQKTIAVRLWPEEVSGLLMQDLMRIPAELEVCQIVLPIGTVIASGSLLRRQREQECFDLLSGGATSPAATDTAVALELLKEGKTTWMETQFQITVRAETSEKVADILRTVADLLSSRRILFNLETRGCPVCWFNRIPDHDKLLRPLKLFSSNVAALWPFQFSPVGLFHNPWGDAPIRLFPTTTGQSYAFQFHVSPRPQSVGHYLVFAPTGGGKSTILMHLLGGLTRFAGVRSYILDSKEGTRFMVETMGGTYCNYDRLALNPLDIEEDTPTTRLRLYLLLRSMLPNLDDSPKLESDLQHVITVALRQDLEHRTFNQIYKSGFPHGSEIKQYFHRWVVDEKGNRGQYAHLFNAPRDMLAGFLEQSPLVGINMNEALDDPNLASPIVTHICDMISNVAAKNGRGFNIFIDEAANLLRNPVFRANAAIMLREYRKLNGCVGLAFQDPSALHKSGIGDAVLENVSTIIFFPSPMGNKAAYEPFNLNEEEHNFIFSSPPDGARRVLLVKRDASSGFRESVILNVDLGQLGHEVLRFYRSGTDAVLDLFSIQEKWGDQWLHHV